MKIINWGLRFRWREPTSTILSYFVDVAKEGVRGSSFLNVDEEGSGMTWMFILSFTAIEF